MQFPTQKYGVIYADPPWQFKTYSEKGLVKSPQAHYQCETLGDIKSIPVGQAALDDSVLYMWATFPMLPQAVELMDAWGFKYKSGGAWHKKTKHGKTAFGTGYIFRSAAELFLVGTRGKPSTNNRSTRNIIEAQVREHSRKPDCTYDLIENLFDGPYLELFARQTRPGWDAWGNEVGKFDAEAAE
ncbi:MT-A70 family methyltransferase [Terasakiella pusilla]|uniref:MT-A70 family methyltransferase n=1 Tax=Terasakiella pusilla TaxID=64973 RepID=UPI003AA92478